MEEKIQMTNKYTKTMLILFNNQENTNQDHNEANILYSVKLINISKYGNTQ